MIPDNSKAHTVRCVFRAKTIPYKSAVVERMLWVHDIPELTEDRDIAAPKRFHKKEVAKKVEVQERETAKKLLNNKDFKLYLAFQTAENLLQNHNSTFPKIQDALVAKTIDTIDGNLTTHYFFTKWLKKNTYNGKIPGKKVLKYTFKVYKISKKAINSGKVKKEIKDIINYLLNSQLKQVIKMWIAVEEDKIPDIMKKELIGMEREINK
jgi:hypothetical protein